MIWGMTHERRLWRTRLPRASGLVGMVALALGTVPLWPWVNDPPMASSEAHLGDISAPLVRLLSATHHTDSNTSSSTATEVARAEQHFTVSLLQQLSRSSPSSTNLVISPSSLATALSMLDLGARGQTASQIAQVLGTQHMGSVTQAAGWGTIDTEIARTSVKDGASVHSANAMWVQEGLDSRFGVQRTIAFVLRLRGAEG